jgi:hypothetical protein
MGAGGVCDRVVEVEVRDDGCGSGGGHGGDEEGALEEYEL